MPRKYGKKSEETVEEAMHKYKRGKLKSGRAGKKVKSRKQAIAIGLSEAREKGAKVPKAPKKSRKKSTTRRTTAKRTTHPTSPRLRRAGGKKSTSRKSTARSKTRSRSKR